jgi:hypothetical protein
MLIADRTVVGGDAQRGHDRESGIIISSSS